MVSSVTAGYSPNFDRSALQLSGTLNYDDVEHFSATVDLSYRLFRDKHSYWVRSGWRNDGGQRVRTAVGLDGESAGRGELERIAYSALAEKRDEENYLEGDVQVDHSRFRHTSTVSVLDADSSTRVYSGLSLIHI